MGDKPYTNRCVLGDMDDSAMNKTLCCLLVFFSSVCFGDSLKEVDSYLRIKARNGASIEKQGDLAIIRYVLFDSETGMRMSDREIVINKQELLDEREAAQARIDNINAVLSEIGQQ